MEFMVELMKVINTFITNLIRRNLASARKSCQMLHHIAVSIKVGPPPCKKNFVFASMIVIQK